MKMYYLCGRKSLTFVVFQKCPKNRPKKKDVFIKSRGKRKPNPDPKRKPNPDPSLKGKEAGFRLIVSSFRYQVSGFRFRVAGDSCYRGDREEVVI